MKFPDVRTGRASDDHKEQRGMSYTDHLSAMWWKDNADPGFDPADFRRECACERMHREGLWMNAPRSEGVIWEWHRIIWGAGTDILDCCPKAEGMIMLIRSMSPRVLAVDEIGAQEEIRARRVCYAVRL